MSRERVLIIEDEEDIQELIRYTLQREGYRITQAASGEDGYNLIRTEKPDLVVLDLMLPGMDGLEVCRRVKQDTETRHVPIIIASAKGEESDIVVGLELGADDYLVKPFSFAELLARVRIILRRGHAGNEGTMLKVADLELDLLRRRVSRNGKRVDLTAKEFGLLELLMRRHGEVLPRSLIASQVWDMNFDSDTNVIEVAMRRLRVKIDEGHAVKLIQTVRGMGYVLDVPEEE